MYLLKLHPIAISLIPYDNCETFGCDSDSKHTLCNMVYLVFICKNIKIKSYINIYININIYKIVSILLVMKF